MVMDSNRIAAFPPFADLPPAELDELAGAMREVQVEAGATVVRVDDYGSTMYLIEAGTADVVSDSGDAVKALGPGDAFGEIGLLLTGQRTASVVARIPQVRAAMLDYQRAFARRPEGAVLDGRDIGTVVCPDADVKLYVTASPEVRAERRYRERLDRGERANLQAVLEDTRRRDERDENLKSLR